MNKSEEFKISKDLARLLIRRGDMLKLMRKDSLYRFMGQEELKFEMMKALYHCKLRNLKLDEYPYIKCLRKDLVGTKELQRFIDIIQTNVRYMDAETLAIALEIDEMLLERGEDRYFIFFHYDRVVNIDSTADLYSVVGKILKKAISIFGVERFKNLMLSCPVKSRSVLEFYLKEYEMDENILRLYFDKYILYKIEYKSYRLIDDYYFEFFDIAYEKGIITDKDLENIIIIFQENTDRILKRLDSVPILRKNIQNFFKIVCNNDEFEKYWEFLYKTFEKYVTGKGYECVHSNVDIFDAFDI